MSIEFRCSGCNKLLRVGDESAGKKSRCPDCGNIQDIPLANPYRDDAGRAASGPVSSGDSAYGASYGASGPMTGSSAGGFSNPSSAAPAGTFGGSPFASDRQVRSGNPYADQTTYGDDNPYRSPPGGMATPRTGFPLTDMLVRSKVQGPATALVIVSVLSLLFWALMVLVSLGELQNDPEAGFMLVGCLVCAAAKLTALVGAIQMQRLRSYPLAMTAAVISVIPCLCWIVEIPFGVWAIVVLSDNSVRRAFSP